MRADYYQNTVYPIQDKVLKIVGALPVDFYLTGGTALARAYLHHRYSDDLDFFLNASKGFKQQVEAIIDYFNASKVRFDPAAADDSYARIFVYEGEATLKLDFVNDVPFRKGSPVITDIFPRTDNILNILSNKLAALSRYAVKDVADIVFISQSIPFNWEEMFMDASEKDLWANPVNAAEILEKFPPEKLNEIVWVDEIPDYEWFSSQINHIIPEMLEGSDNSLFKTS